MDRQRISSEDLELKQAETTEGSQGADSDALASTLASAPEPPPAGPPAAVLAAGTVIDGRYELRELLGRGGIGSVYLARHILIDKQVALKVLDSGGRISESAKKRFLQEAKAASKLSHRNLTSVIDYGVLELGEPYLVMELVEGTTLSELLGGGKTLPHAQTIDIFAQACAGIAHAHAQGVVHRDLKPSNIMIVREDQGILIKVVDFGLAKIADQSEQSLTKTGEIFGSPLYMSPEQARGQTTDTRTDLYSLGCAMYECVTGKPPFCGENALQTMYMHAHERVPAPHSVRHDVPKLLEQTIMKCLSKKPSDRFASALDVKRELESVTIAAARGGKRNWAVRAALALSMALLGTLLVVYALQFFQAQKAQRAARKAIITSMPKPTSAPPAPISFHGSKPLSSAEIAGLFSAFTYDNPPDQELLELESAAQANPERFQKMKVDPGGPRHNQGVIAFQRALANQALANKSPQKQEAVAQLVCDDLSEAARSLYSYETFDQAGYCADKALSLGLKEGPAKLPNLFVGLRARHLLFASAAGDLLRGKDDAAQSKFALGLRLLQAVNPPRTELFEAYWDKSEAYFKAGNVFKNPRYSRLAVDVLDQSLPYTSPISLQRANVLVTKANSIRNSFEPSDQAKAVELYEQVIQIQKQLGLDYDNAFAMEEEGRTLVDLNRLDKAIAILKHAASIYNSVPSSELNLHHLGRTSRLLAEAYEKKSDYPQAEHWYKKSSIYYRQAQDIDAVRDDLTHLRTLYNREGKQKEASKLSLDLDKL